MRAQITALEMGEFSQSLSGSYGGSCNNAGDDGLGGYASIWTLFYYVQTICFICGWKTFG